MEQFASLSVVGVVTLIASAVFLSYKQRPRSKKFPPLPEKIDLNQLMQGKEEAKIAFCESLKTYRFAVLKCDDTTKQIIADFKESGLEFFSQDEETKINFCGKPVYPEDSSYQVRKVNKGYLIIKGMKEYLKFKLDETLPETPSNFKSRFNAVYKSFHDISRTCLEYAATYQVNGQPFMDPAMLNEVKKKLQRSSVSLIRYFPVSTTEATPDDRINNSNEYEVSSASDKDKDTDVQAGFTYPSKTHTDTGILTLIICSDVAGLQVWDIHNNKWLEVEKMVVPKEDMFVIMGRKMELFSKQSPSVFLPTTHRVALPVNTERSSLLFFQDVPQ